MKFILEKMLPKGPAWEPRVGGNLYTIYSVVNEAIVKIADIAKNCGKIWNPIECTSVNDLADEYGVELFYAGNESSYRKYLSTFVFKSKKRRGQANRLQQAIIDAGFSSIVVVKNNMLDDPHRWSQLNQIMYCGSSGAYCGSESAYCGYTGYPVLANGEMKNDNGYNIGIPLEFIPERYAYCLFIAGSVTYNQNGSINTLTPASISKSNRERLETVILRDMPSDCVAIIVSSFVDGNVISETGYAYENTISETGQTGATISQTGT